MRNTAEPARLDPQTLPPATASRFLLLIASVLAAASYVFGWLVEQIDEIAAAPAQCAQTARDIAGRILPGDLISWYGDCVQWASVQQAVLIALAIGAFVVITVGIYLSFPRRLSSGLKPLSELASHPQFGPLAVQVRCWTDREGHPGVELYYDRTNRPSRAFGRYGRYRVALAAALFTRRLRDPESPELGAVLRHELAHIRNRDIDLTYLAIASWWGFIVLVAFLFAVVAIRAPELLFSFSWRLAVLLLLLWIVRADLLRVREFYADIAAADSPSDEDAIVVALNGPTAAGGGWRDPYHPRPQRRVDMVRQGDPLFWLPWRAVLATGALVGLSYTPTSALATLLLPGSLFAKDWIVGLIYGLLVAGVLSGSVWRVALWSAVRGRRVWLLPYAGLFVLALLAGQLVAPRLPAARSWPEVYRPPPAMAAAGAALLLLIVYAYLRWTLICARAWLPLARHPRRAYRFGVLQSGVVLGIWIAGWFQFVGMASLGGSWLTFGLVVGLVIVNPAALLSVAWAAGYPLLTWQSGRAEPTSGHRWWRKSDVDLGSPVLPDRSPAPWVYAVIGLVVLGHSALVLPQYGTIRTAIERLNTEYPQPFVEQSLVLLRVLVLPGLVAAAVAGLAIGLTVGSRGRTGLALLTALAACLPTAGLLFVAILAHLTWASPMVRDLPTLWTALSHVGGVPQDSPAQASAGLMMFALYVGLVFACGPAALVGALIRAPVRPHQTRQPIGRVRAAIIGTPLVAVTVVVGMLGATEWPAAYSPDLVLGAMIDRRLVEQVTGHVARNSVDPARSCSSVLAVLSGQLFDPADAPQRFDLTMAQIAANALAADDPTLPKLGEGTRDALLQAKPQRAARGVGAIAQYCATVLTGR